MTVNMQTTFAGVTFQNPVSTASGTYGFGIEYGEFLPVERLGSITTKGLTLAPRSGNPGRRLAETPSGMLNSIGLENPGVELFKRDYVSVMRERLGECKIIANFSGGTVEDYGRISAALSEVPEVAMYEVNISCPNVAAGGMTFGVDCASAAAVCAAVKKETDKPVIMKLSPNVTDIAAIAKACEEAGADGLALINTLLGIKIDIKTQKPLLGNITGGLSGAAVRPVGVRMVWQVSQAVSIPVLGMGGITTWEDAVEYFLAGAQMISVGAACFKNPYAPFSILDGVQTYCEAQGVNDVNELVGKAWKN
mgnify:CR=1 FL=1